MGITPPTKFAAIWANDEPGGFLTQPIPTASQPAGRASLNDGFPQITFVDPISGGGKAVDGRDMNGILYMLTAAAQFQQAGGVYAWDSAFEGNIGGYPLGAVVAHATITGFFWINGTANNTTNPDAGGTGWTGFQIANQPATGAQLQYTSTVVLTLAPKAGGWLWINGFNYAVPASLTVTNSGLLASTLYYVYAAISAGNMVLDAPSTTGYTVNARGMAVKSTDATRTLVGFCATDGGGLFQSGLLTRSYWQRPRSAFGQTSFSANHSTSSATFVELSTQIRNNFLVWAGENVDWSVSGGFNSSTSGTNAFTGVGFDGITPELQQAVVGGPAGSNYLGSIGLRGIKTGLSEGLHYATLLGASGGGSASWFGGASTPGAYDVIDIVING